MAHARGLRSIASGFTTTVMGDDREVSHFKTTRKGIAVSFGPEERVFLADVLPLLAGIGEVGRRPRSHQAPSPCLSR